MQLEDWLDDLCVRFIINLPPEELQSVERICFQVEEAQWFYEDFIRPLDPSLPSLNLRAFSLRIFQHCPLFSQWSAQHHTTAFAEFLAYKSRVPVRGAIMLNEAMDEVVLVKGWKKSANWSFPRGKINKDENDLDCAVREVYEETGFDIRAAGLVKDEKDMKYIEVTMREQHMRLYVFRGVPKDTHFEPKTRKEISKIEWYKLTDLPTLKKSRQHEGSGTEQPTVNANKFYMVAPFLNPLKKWIAQQRKKENRYSSHLAAPPMVPEQLSTEDDLDYEGAVAGLPATASQIVSDLPEVTAPATADPTAHLKQMLNIGSSQSVRAGSVPQPSHMQQVDAEKSNALLALLRSAPHGQPRPIPQTPLEQISAPPQTQQSPHVSHIRPPQLLHAQPPPSFEPQTQHAVQPSFYRPDQQPTKAPLPPTSTTAPSQSQPQGGPYQRTIDPELEQETEIRTYQPSAPPASALPKLTNHTKSLLDVFRGATNTPDAAAPSPNQGLLELLTRGKPLPKPEAHPRNDAAPLAGSFGGPQQVHAQIGIKPSTDLGAPLPVGPETQAAMAALAPVGRPVNARQTSLLELFKPSSRPEQANVTGLQNQLPVELAATTSASPAQRKEEGNKDELLLALLKKGDQPASKDPASTNHPSPREGETSATINGPLNQPEFEAISRPHRHVTNELRRSPLTSNRTLYDPNQPTPIKILARPDEFRQQQQPPRSPKGIKPPPKRTVRDKTTVKSQSKPFQPQILRRPQTAESSEPDHTGSEGTSQHAVLAAAVPSPPLITTPPEISARPSFTRQASQTPSQKQALLSLFGGGPETTPRATMVRPGSGVVSPLSTSQIMNGEVPLSAMEPLSTRTSRVGSMASNGSGPASHRLPSEKRQTGAENKAFLLGYLGRIASQGS
ncbi:mRNA-decapping enzyme subunit 2 [Elasticomyces elasticus]|uniref:mRNA-decapping enzyme subunit 2 n=1 Tax=Exophiala sideris TaxID=1016849 RepID=A0ABR0JKA2_9EURO|nr:mRNA-decapping enzyme subunit 2 [Elasticomyces elasticus]KAK5034292.1 mRNA-decapping enzyme subunit 2 [Exophiala sideris]KAK5042589.1 mRNA-decapping enzyme subunit 2 [Exophiala sideris]KAK5065671.1 mRNA-decapping enzyme subunit 2 [Exophiala sideris]KAK5185871.1 mRNA-decapping enzyme subunit 2 [Eurotiomycetes sp. CCFEE 6388]